MTDTRKFGFKAAGWIALTSAIFATTALAQQRDRLPRECRQEIRQLCAPDGGVDREAIRACLRERASELSENCQAELRERVDQRRENQSSARPYVAPPQVTRTVIFGDHQRQQVDVYEPEGAVEELPLVLFIHGGGWSMGSHKRVQSKPAYFNSNDFYFASTGYRLLPHSPVEEQASDVGAAIKALRGQAASIGFDPDKIVLMGHSAGAHLAALVATDPSYAGEAFDAIRGVILLDGAGYDVAANMAVAGPRGWQIYNTAFSSDPERQAALSPVTHVGGADAPHWLALYVAERDIAREQSELLVSGLGDAGAQAAAISIAGTDHGRMNRELGTAAGAAQTEAIDAFLAQVF